MGWEEARVVPKQPPTRRMWNGDADAAHPAAGAMPPPCHLTEGTVPMQYAAEGTLYVPAASPVPQPRLLLDNTGEGHSLLAAINYYCNH